MKAFFIFQKITFYIFIIRILSGTKCSKDNKKIVEYEDGCLGVELDEDNGCLRLRHMNCLLTNPFICKAGETFIYLDSLLRCPYL